MLILAKITQGSASGYAEYLEGKTLSTSLGDYYLKDANESKRQDAGQLEPNTSDSTRNSV